MTGPANPESPDVPVHAAAEVGQVLHPEPVEAATEPVVPGGPAPGADTGLAPADQEPKPESQSPEPDSSEPESTEPESSEPPDPEDPIADLAAAVARLASEVKRDHDRAQHREAVIDTLHAESERLRLGERRGAIRPLLVELARLRDDLTRQATELPEQFDREGAQKLLLSFADTIEVSLDTYGVAVESPRAGDDFSVRQHRIVGSTPTTDPALVRTISAVRRDGYRDIEADMPIAPAEVMVYVAAPASPSAPEPEAEAEPADREPPSRLQPPPDLDHL